MRGWKLRELLAGGAIIGGLASLLVVHGGIRLGTPFFGAETGVFDAIMALLTLLALIAGGVGAFFSYQAALEGLEASREKDRWEQFRAAVQMLGANTHAETVAGIEILNQLGEANPDPFDLLTFAVLRNYIDELSKAAKAVIWDRSTPITIEQAAGPWPDGDVAEVTAFVALGAAVSRFTVRPEGAAHTSDGRAIVYNILLVNRVIPRAIFRNLYMDRIALDRVVFTKCDFRGSRMVGRALSVTFEDCDLRGAEFFLEQSAAAGTPPKFVNCIVEGATFFGKPLEEWIKEYR